MQSSYAQQTKEKPSAAEQEIINLSKQKWFWMADKNVDSLNALFDEKSVFVHMGGSARIVELFYRRFGKGYKIS